MVHRAVDRFPDIPPDILDRTGERTDGQRGCRGVGAVATGPARGAIYIPVPNLTVRPVLRPSEFSPLREWFGDKV